MLHKTYEDEDATAAALRRGTPVPWSRMFNDVRTTVRVDQVALGTSLETHFGCMVTGREIHGNDTAALLEDALGSMDPLKCVYLWRETPLCDLPSELATHARALDPTADPVALER